ncbi:inosine/xanthosine triphosphatase [Rufibacter sp. LB8]|uniref:inosine/xanthosine triphosphatase n=1 Tax=Rufibacter sp. LB8 TaxID=2777781 RepID=UPI00178C435D|nr:inosine/xanthosine triphosphatase [Rufibacter sp. LB8]
MSSKKVVVASANPVKVQAALAGLQRMFPHDQFEAVPLEVPSGVADQPMTDQETLQGALNRVENAFTQRPEADFWIGLEGGVEQVHHELASFAWVVVKAGTTWGKARSGTFFLPQKVADLVNQGVELGPANDQIFSQVNSKQKGGAIGILSHGALGRKELYEQAVVLALVPFQNPELY